jgi:two-component system nitrate/nitrite response regulator NarL
VRGPDVSDLLRVVIADGHAPTRVAVRAALEAGGCHVVAEVPHAAGAIAAAQQHRPDVCLLDVHMPGSGIVAATEIAHRLPDTAVVILTDSRDDDDLFAALRAGAAGYLLKDTDPARLAPALRSVLAGDSVLPRRMVATLMGQFRAEQRGGLSLRSLSVISRLTEREAEVLDLLVVGLSTEQIAGRLFVAPVTVRTHVRAILRKLRVTDRAAAVRLALGETPPGTVSLR